jgi:hypothetical protein
MRHLASTVPLVIITCAGCGQEAARGADSTAARRAQAPVVAAESSLGAPLRDEDYLLAGLATGGDSSGVETTLGLPDSTVTRARADTIGPSEVREWWYRDVVVTFAADRVYGITLTTPRFATARGVRVGDPAEAVRAVYGSAALVAGDTLQYVEDLGGPYVGFIIADARVSRIVVFIWE